MSQPMIVWCAIVGVLLFAFVFRTVERYFGERHHKAGNRPHHVIEIGKESEMFYVPRDKEDDDFED